MLSFITFLAGHNGISHMSWECNCHDVCKILLWSVGPTLNQSTLNFDQIVNLIEIPSVGWAQGHLHFISESSKIIASLIALLYNLCKYFMQIKSYIQICVFKLGMKYIDVYAYIYIHIYIYTWHILLVLVLLTAVILNTEICFIWWSLQGSLKADHFTIHRGTFHTEFVPKGSYVW